MAKKTEKPKNLDTVVAELTGDLQRVRADFENYRKRVEGEKHAATETGEAKTVLKLLPVIDTIERAVLHIPDDIVEHKWVQGVAGLVKQLDTALTSMDLARIDATPGTKFNPELHQAIQFDDSAEGEEEVIESELQPGYLLKNSPIRHSMVKVTRR